VTEVGTGVIVGLNAAAEEGTGYFRNQIVGLRLWEIASPAHQEMLKRALEDPTGEGLPPTFESTVNLRSGKPRRIVWSSTYLTDESGARSHLVITGIDMSSDAANGGLFAHLMGAANSTALISTDRRGRVTFCSTGAEAMLGLRGVDLVGEPMPVDMFDASEVSTRTGDAQDPADLGFLRSPEVPEILPGSTGELLHVDDWTLTRTDGRRLIASVAVSASRDVRGVHVGYVAVAHDVTEAHRAEQALADALATQENAVERLHELDRAKSEFVATVSHELRTPMTNIVGCVEVLQDGLAGDLNTGQRGLVDSVSRNSERLIALADDLVTLARAETGDLDMSFTDLDLRDVVWSAKEALQTLLLNRSLETDLEIPSVRVPVRGDAAFLTRAVRNLLSNAVKFTDDGGAISCRLTIEDDEAVLEVSDSGVGIPEVEQRDLFTSFFRSSTAVERATQGTGLGLSIVASIVHQHDGQILVDSEHLQGCTFTVRLPLTRSAATQTGV
jgi:hypothetical protein